MEQTNPETFNRSFTCLIADDSMYARKHISMIVARTGGRVIGEAENGAEAVALYGQLKPDLLLMDITMPELDGLEALRKIITKDPAASVIIVSSIGHKSMVEKALIIGAKHFCIKPYTPDYAATVIRAVIESK